MFLLPSTYLSICGGKSFEVEKKSFKLIPNTCAKLAETPIAVIAVAPNQVMFVRHSGGSHGRMTNLTRMATTINAATISAPKTSKVLVRLRGLFMSLLAGHPIT